MVKSRKVIAHDDGVIASTTIDGVITFASGDAVVSFVTDKAVVIVGTDDDISTFTTGDGVFALPATGKPTWPRLSAAASMVESPVVPALRSMP